MKANLRFWFSSVALLLACAAPRAFATPTISITAPATGSTQNLVGTPPTFTITATTAIGSSPVGTLVSSVNFLVNGTSIGTVGGGAFGAGYSFDWHPTAPGTYTLTAQVTDTSVVTTGTSPNLNTATSPLVIVTITGAFPSVTLSTTPAATSFGLGSTVTLNATATPTSGATVSRVDFLSGTTVIGSAFSSSGGFYSFSWIPSVAGATALTARVTDTAGYSATSAASNVNITVPGVTLTSPLNGAGLTVGTSVTLAANAFAVSPATVAKVDFLTGTTLIGTATSVPYSVTWTPTTAGNVSLTARVTDSNGAPVTSSAVTVTVSNAISNPSSPPTITLTSPVNGDVVPLGTTATLTAYATGGTGASVTRVDFLVGGSTVATALAPTSGSTYTASWTPTVAAVPVLTAKVTDSNGNTATSAAVNVNVTAPNITLTSPSAGTSVNVNVPVILTANATAVSPATISKVDFFAGTTLVGTATGTGPSYSVNWTPAAAGNTSLTARVTDSNGAAITSSAVSVSASVANPTVALTSPAPGSALNANTPVTLTATATGGAGTVAKVDFFAGTTLVGTATSAPYSVSWTPTTIGAVSLTARVTDSANATATSSAVSVTVGASVVPVVALSLSPNTAAAAGSTTLPAGATRNIVATVTPVSGTAIERVEFFINGTKVGQDVAAPYSYRYLAPTTAGTYVLSALATDNAGNTGSAQVSLNVVSAVGSPPTINLLAPTNGATVVPGSAIVLAAAALGNGGSIASVQFFANGSPAGINSGNALTASPYTSSFTPTLPGTYLIDAIATDDRGNTTISNSVFITAAFSTPTVSITSPSTTGTVRVTPNVPLNLTATATAGTGASVLLVEFLLDGVQIGSRSAPTSGTSYTLTWTPTTAQLGTHVLMARVTDSNSLSAVSPANVSLNIANVVGTPPTVTIAAPTGTAATNLQTLSTVNLIANAFATGTNNSLTSVEFFLNDASIGVATREQTTNLYRLAYNFGAYDFSTITPTTPDANGNTRYPLALYAIAKDNNGNQTISATTNLIVTQSTSTAPTVTLQAAGVTTVTQNTAVQLTASPADIDGTVVSLQLFANGTASGGAVLNPGQQVSLTYTPTTAGRFNLYVTATDDTGNVAVSTPSVVITANPTAAPTTALTQPANDATITNVGALVFLEATASTSDPLQVPTVSFVATGSGGARTNITNVQRVGTTTTYRATWVPTVADTYTITSSAVVGSLSATSAVSHRVQVKTVSGIAPVISITGGFPTSVTTASTANFTATASDGDGAVTSVEFFVNRSSVGQAVRDQLNNTWRLTASFGGLIAGSYEIVALARDNTGNLTASNTGTIVVTAATSSVPPSITVFASPTSVAFGQSVVLTASASSNANGGSVSGIQYFANGTFLAGRTTPGAYQFTWTNAASGTYNVYAIATDNAGNTTVSPAVQVTVRVFNPVADNDAFVLQSYIDIANNNSPNLILAASYSAQLTAGTLTRGQLVSTLTHETGFAGPSNILAAYYVLMGQWPNLTNYANLLGSFRNNLAGAIGNILTSPEYIAKYPEHVTPTVALLENPAGAIPATTFEARIWANVGLGRPSAAADVAFRNNPTALATLGRGYNVAGLNTAIAEFITNTNSTNAAFNKMVAAATLYYQLDKPPLAMSTDDIAARVTALVKLPDVAAIADAVLQDTLYLYRYVTITTQPQSLTVAAGANATFSVVAVGQPPLAYQWLFNGSPIVGANTTSLTLTNVDTTKTGAYSVVVTSSVGTATSQVAILGLSSTGKVTGASRQVAADIRAATGVVYDQVLLQGDSTTITADPGKITRLSYVDLNDDIVQVEFSGAGSLSLVLEDPAGPAPAANYDQPDVAYMKGHAGIVITGANETTNVAIFSVGRATAINQGLFRADVNYDGVADIGYIAILSTDGHFGGVRTGNASYFATKGYTGIFAPGVQFDGPVYVGDIHAADDATPVLLLGSAADTRITGGNLAQANGAPVEVSGLTNLQFVDGRNSQGKLLPAQANQAQFDEDGVDVTDALVSRPAP
ncbi:MAG TPA: Ig-like domain-containing protein [Opitutaceae bacterium]|nr:Ig-like domain-containing protein [Opitutaceae bacterium]